MKKFFKILLALMLVLTLSISTQAPGFAAEEGPAAQEETAADEARIDISEFTVELDSYLVMATGENVTPKVTAVNLWEGKPYAPSSSVKETLKPEDYEVSYYKVLSFSEEKYEQVDEICTVGEYKVTVMGKEPYCGEASGLFTVVGKQQHLTLEKTRYSLKMGASPVEIKPETDGDGEGFSFLNIYPDVIRVYRYGNEAEVKPLKAGRAVVKVSTRGDKLYQPAGAAIVFEISPAKVKWDKKEIAALNRKSGSKNNIAWNKVKGATGYEIEYSTSSRFTKPKTSSGAKEYHRGKVKVSASRDRLKLKKRRSGRTYYVRIRALTKITDGRGNSKTLKGSWSAPLKMKI